MAETLGIIGCGKMGLALLGGVLRAKLFWPEDVFVFDAAPGAMHSAVARFEVTAAASGAEVVDRAETVLLCVKPQTFPEMLAQLGGARDRLLISIAAGVRIAAIESGVGDRHRVIRVMPNTPAQVGRGAAAFSLGSKATPADAEVARALLSSAGYCCQVSEDLLDAVTAVSGSGPAYVFYLVESMVKAGVELGLGEREALELASHTVAGAAELLLATGENPATLRENVTSPNGTTFAALESFRKNGFERIVREAMQAAKERSVELGRG
jgi:pyrroline-5-carboxylate reductase